MQPDRPDVRERAYLDAALGPAQDTDVFEQGTPHAWQRQRAAPSASRPTTEMDRLPRIGVGGASRKPGLARSLPSPPPLPLLAAGLAASFLLLLAGVAWVASRPDPAPAPTTVKKERATEWEGIKVKRGLK